jgi:hypothetical protein
MYLIGLGVPVLNIYNLVNFSNASGYQLPSIWVFDAASFIYCKSSIVNSIFTAPTFSSKRFNFVVPGIGVIQLFELITSQAIFELVLHFCFATALSKSINAWFALMASG